MKPIEQRDLVRVQSFAEVVETYKIGRGAASTVIHSHDKVVVFFKDPLTSGAQESDLFDELHIQHQKSARLLIVVIPDDA